MYSFKYSVSKGFTYHKKELELLILQSFIFTFILSLVYWSSQNMDVNLAVFGLVKYLILSFIALYIVRSVQRSFAFHYGFKPEWSNSLIVLLIQTVVGVISLGHIPLLFSGNLFMKQGKYFSIGKYDLTRGRTEHIISIVSGIFPLLFVGLFKEYSFFFELGKVMALILFFTWLPIPTQDGIYLLYNAGIPLYIGIMSFLVVFSLLFFFTPFWICFLAAVISLFLVPILFVKRK